MNNIYQDKEPSRPLYQGKETSRSLYLNIWDYDDPKYPFQIFIGGYATGKSYSGLKGAVENCGCFTYMRRTRDAFEVCCGNRKGDAGNPFNPINEITGWNLGYTKEGDKIAMLYHRDSEGRPMGLPIGNAVYLAGLAKVRGAGLEKTELILYDEFIKEAHEPKMREEFRALMRGYETINRNKEYRGLPPTRLWLISNAEDIYNPIFIGLGIVSDCERMARKSQEHKYYPDRGLAVHLLHSSPEFLKRKSETAVMKLMAGTQYADVGLNNSFANNDFSLVGYKRLHGYHPVAALDFAYIYKKKGERRWYVSYAEARCMRYTASQKQDELLFRRTVATGLRDQYVKGNIEFESYELKEFFLEHIF